MTLEQLTESAADYAKKTLIGEPGASLLPTFLIQGRDRVSLVGTPFDGEDEKNIMAAAIQAMLKMEHAHSYSFMSEAWALTQSLDEEYIQPAKSPKRREVVVIIAVDRDGAGKMLTYEMKRDKAGVVTDLAIESDVNSIDGGRFSNLFAD
jgi:hypothetical protein